MKKTRKPTLIRKPTFIEITSDLDDEASFLIRTAPQEQQKDEKNEPLGSIQRNKTQIAALKPLAERPVASQFVHLPIIHPSLPLSIHPYISFKAIYPTPQNQAPSDPDHPINLKSTGPSSSEVDGRTVYLMNLPRSVTPDCLARLFAQALQISAASIEVSIREPQLNKNSLSSCEFNLFQRDLQVFHSTSNALEERQSKKKRDHLSNGKSNAQTNKKPIRLFDSKLDEDALFRKLWPRNLVPSAHVRFETSEEIDKLKNLTNLPLKWPEKTAADRSQGWMSSYETRRKMTRISIEQAHDYADLWIRAMGEGRIPSLPQDEIEGPNPAENKVQQDEDADSENGGSWTVVKRGGHHGRSATIPTQAAPPSSLQNRGADPYAQSSMADRDQHAAVKVMTKKFAQNFASSSTDQPINGSKRKAGALHPDFYKSNSSMINKSKRMRMNQIRENFKQDKLKMKRPST